MARVEALLERDDREAASTALETLRQSSDACHRAPVLERRHARAGQGGASTRRLERRRCALDAGSSCCSPTQTPAARAVFVMEAVQQALRFDPARASALIDQLDRDRRGDADPARSVTCSSMGRPRAAVGVLERAPAGRWSAAREWNDDVCRVGRARRRHRSSQRSPSRRARRESHPERLIRSIIDPGPDVHKLLMSCTPDAEMQPYVEELIAASSRTVAPRRRRGDRANVGRAPDAREVTVLRYLCSRLTYEEIAATRSSSR